MISLEQFVQALIVGLLMGALYALMATGITFIAGIMKVINWSMGDFHMIGSYIQYGLLTGALGGLWFVGIPIVMLAMLVVGFVVQWLLLAPMFKYSEDHRFEYATIITIALSVMLQNGAVFFGGPNQRRPPDYLDSVDLPGLTIRLNGNRLAAGLGAVVILVAFFVFLRRTWVGMALRAISQNRLGASSAGMKLTRFDMLGFGIGVALAAGAGALLAPVFSVYPGNGTFAIVKGFMIVVIGGLGSLPGAVVAAFLLALSETFGSAFISSNYQDLYGFGFLIVFLVVRPQGLFGERERRF